MPSAHGKRSRRILPGLTRTAWILLSLPAVWAVALPARAQSASQFPRNDVQGWTDLEATHDLQKKVQLTMNGALRWSDDASHVVYRRAGAGLAFKVNKYLTLSPYFNYYSTDSSPVHETREKRVVLAATIGVPAGSWKVRDRNAIERRFLIGSRTWRYRNRLELERGIQVAHSQLRIFLWDEVFYDSASSAWSRNRAALGAGKELSKRLSVDLYYLRQNDGYSHPGDLNVIGVTLHARF
jgi:Protein of unknown function (DUF2490)